MPPYRRSFKRLKTSSKAWSRGYGFGSRAATRSRSWVTATRASRVTTRSRTIPLDARIASLEGMIETKHGQWTSANNIAIPHNNTIVISKDDGGVLNPFQCSQGVGDPMSGNSFQRIGDKITIRGMRITGFFEGALARSKVHFRVMLIRGAKGETFNRSTIFRNVSDNKMLDMINTERFTVVWQRKFNVQPPGYVTGDVNAAGEATATSARPGITGNRIINAWIPGRKFGPRGTITYEDASQTQVKFYDYRFVVLAYDWFGTPQDVNNVGRVNEFYSMLYYKDA